MNSSQACLFHSPLQPISLPQPSYGFVSKRDPSLCYQPFRSRRCLATNLNISRTRETCFIHLNRRHLSTKERKSFSISYSDKRRNESIGSDEVLTDALDVEIVPQNSVVSKTLQDNNNRPKSFRNRFLDFVRISSVLNTAAERFFKSEIRRRLFVTAVLLVLSRVGYFIPLPGFDRRLIPQDYLSFVSGSVEELGEFGAEIKLSLFQLGLSPQIIASILMQVLCHVLPSLVKLRKEGLDGHEKIKSYIGRYSSGLHFSPVFCICSHSSGQACNVDSISASLRCNDDDLALEGSPITEVEPYIPFNINPAGMQPVLTTTYLLAFPSILASILGSPFLLHVKEILNPESTVGAPPWVYYSIYAFFVFLFNIFDIANLPKEIADYLNKMGARIPNIKPGKATIEYLTKIQASTRFWGKAKRSTVELFGNIIQCT
ncbi:hypothetical protein Bca4012_001767 [Brassica carinata]